MVRKKPQGIADAMFMGGAIGGRSAAEERCAASDNRCSRCEGKGTGSAWVAQLVERVLGKDEVTGSIPVPGSRMSIRWLRGTESLP